MVILKFLLGVTSLLLVHHLAVAQKIPGERSPIVGDEPQFLSVLKNSKSNSERVEALLNLSAYYLFLPGEEKDDLDKAIQYAQDAKVLSRHLQFEEGYNEAMVLIGKTLNEGDNYSLGNIIFDSVTVSIIQLLEYSKQQNKPVTQARALRQLIDVRLSQARFTEAEKLSLELIELYKTNRFPNLHYIFSRMATIQVIKNDFHQALVYGLAMMRSMEVTSDYASAGMFYGDVGYIYYNLGQYAKSLDYYNTSFTSLKHTHSSFLYDIKAEIANSLIRLGKADEAVLQLENMLKEFPPTTTYEQIVIEKAFGKCYTALKMYDLATIHLNKSAELEKKHSRNLGFLFTQKIIAQMYTEWGKFELARPYVDECFTAGVFPSQDMALLHFLKYRIDSAAGNYISAMKHLRINKTLEEKVAAETKASENQELQIQYETEKKDRELLVKQKNIELLNKERLLQAASLKQANNTRNFIIAGTAILLLLLGITFRRYKEKQRTTIEINNKNLALQQLITEKEWLLKEVHHRVKNNLQTVVSLLESQSAYLQDDALLAVQESQNRVFAMSLIHQKLYQADNVASISMEHYLPELVNYLRESFNVKNIGFFHDIAAMDLDVSQAIPVGLIVNEAVTNAIKYAFPASVLHNKQVSIGLYKKEDGRLVLSISDNGIGMPAELSGGKAGSLGLKLMKGLAEDLSGEFLIESTKGTEIFIIFKVNTPLPKSE